MWGRWDQIDPCSHTFQFRAEAHPFLYQNNQIDLVLMDILMPGTDGLEATLQLTREYLDAKIIAMTGAQGDRNFLDVAKLFGARRVFEKPFDLTKMVEAVNEELAK